MGRGKAAKQRRKMGTKARTDTWKNNVTVLENDLFKNTYKGLDILNDEEFDLMWAAMARELPNSFRFSTTKPTASEAREVFIKKYLPQLDGIEYKDEPVQPFRPVPYLPGDLSWDMRVPKAVVRKNPAFSSLQQFLVMENDVGNLTRQEIVSMIPPLMLKVEPGHVVLDMCAAPGSKSSQLAEMVHAGEYEKVADLAKKVMQGSVVDTQDVGEDYGRSTGLLIANDSDYKRAHMLTHQLKRLNLPNVVVTNHDASIFPSIELPSAKDGSRRQLKYDRILADVPCTGDGTVRKNQAIWKSWNPREAIGLHPLQRRILLRGLELLKVGGRIVYSTCSLNPIENEAVVASAIEACGGPSHVTVVNCSSQLPKLIRKPGLNKWKAFDRKDRDKADSSEPRFWSTYTDYLEDRARILADNPMAKIAELSPEMFPPSLNMDLDHNPQNIDHPERIPLEHCMRIYPHLQDTGGFFIAVLEKLEPIKVDRAPKRRAAEAEEPSGKRTKINSGEKPIQESSVPAVASGAATPETPVPAAAPTNPEANEDLDTNGAESSKPRRQESRQQGFSKQQYEVFRFLDPSNEAIQLITQLYGIHSSFPQDRFFVRNEEGVTAKAIYYTSALAQQILTVMEGKMKFVNAGVKMFVRHDTKRNDGEASWRVQMEGISVVAPWCSNRVLRINDRTRLEPLLCHMFPEFNGGAARDELGEDLYQQLLPLSTGCCLLFCETGNEDADKGFAAPLVLPLWKNPGSLNLMVDKENRRALLNRLFNKTEADVVNHKHKKIDKEEVRAEREEKLAHAYDPISNGDDTAKEMADAYVSTIPSENDTVKEMANAYASAVPAEKENGHDQSIAPAEDKDMANGDNNAAVSVEQVDVPMTGADN